MATSDTSTHRADLPKDILQRIECTELRMRLEEAADALVQEMFELTTRPYTRDVAARITSTIGRVPDPVRSEHWRTIAAARHAYRMLCDVIHGRTAWTRVPQVQLAAWARAVTEFEHLAVSLGLLPMWENPGSDREQDI